MSSLTKNDFPVLNTEELRDEGLAGERKRHPGSMMAGVGLLAIKPTGLVGLIAFLRRLSKGVLGKIAMGVFCTAIYQAIMSFPAFWRGIKVLCAFIGLIGDAKVVKQATDIPGRVATGAPAEPVFKQHVAGDGEERDSTLRGRFRGGIAKGKEATKKLAHDTGEAVAKKAKPIEKDARKAVDEIKDRLGPPRSGDAPASGNAPERVAPGQWAPPARPDFVAPYTGGGMGSFLQPIGPALERGKQAVGGTFERLGRGINDYQAEQALYLERWAKVCPYNGRCGRGRPMKINPRSKVNYGCKICGKGSSYPAAAIRYDLPPGPPFVKSRAFYAWKDEQEKKQARATP